MMDGVVHHHAPHESDPLQRKDPPPTGEQRPGREQVFVACPNDGGSCRSDVVVEQLEDFFP